MAFCHTLKRGVFVDNQLAPHRLRLGGLEPKKPDLVRHGVGFDPTKSAEGASSGVGEPKKPDLVRHEANSTTALTKSFVEAQSTAGVSKLFSVSH